jgi:hypothetical protein
MIHVVTWKWHQRYRHSFLPGYVNVLERMVRRAYDGEHRFICVTDDPFGIDGETFPLWDDFKDIPNPHGATEYPSCFRRLKLFDPETQRAMGITTGDRVVSLDLDTVVIDGLNTLWDRNESFVGWAVKNRHLDRVFNGSMWMLRAGEHAEVWETFDPLESPKEANRLGYLGSDQAWMSYCLADTQAGWGECDGIYTRMQTMRTRGLPSDARVVMFHGPVKPWDAVQNGTPGWVNKYWL